MRNESEAYFFTKRLLVLRADGDTDKLVYTVQHNAKRNELDMNRPDVQFLPEGGQLVAGIASRMAFKAVNTSGQSIPIKGFVLDAKKDTVVSFISLHLGMGYFMFKPEYGQVYTAFVEQKSGTVGPYQLPAVQEQGVVMQVDNSSDKDLIKVYVKHNKIRSNTTDTMTLFAQTRGRIIHVLHIPLTKKSSLVQFSKADFPGGITQLTVFDETHKPVCERLTFVNKNEQISISLTPDKATYKNREKIELAITTTAQGRPVAANLSLAALDARLIPETNANRATIVSHLLLSSDLMGTIEQPGYYFDPAQQDRWLKLDLLLMTQGWRRFTWDDVVRGTIPPIKYPVERGLSLTGRVVRPNPNAMDSPITLSFLLAKRDSTRQFFIGETDELGNFCAYNLDFTDTTTVVIQGMKAKANPSLAISLDQLLIPTVLITKVPYSPLAFRLDEWSEFIRRTKEYQQLERQLAEPGGRLLQAVTVKAKKYEETDARVIYGTPDATIKFTPLNTAGRMTVLDVIQGKVAGVSVIGTGVDAWVQIRGATSMNNPTPPLFVLDGMPMDSKAIPGLSVQDIDRVDILKGASAAIYGSQAAAGVISILTKRGNLGYELPKEVAPGTLVAKLPGYAPHREFYAPRYSGKQTEPSPPDYRTTLFWSPMIQTNREGKATVSFFTSDNKADIRLYVEGATIGGMPGVATSMVNRE